MKLTNYRNGLKITKRKRFCAIKSDTCDFFNRNTVANIRRTEHAVMDCPQWANNPDLQSKIKPSYRDQGSTFLPVKEEIKYSILKLYCRYLYTRPWYDKSYLGSKTTMTSGEWTCLISFATAPLTCSDRGGSEKFKMKIYVSNGIRTHTPPVHDRKVAAP